MNDPKLFIKKNYSEAEAGFHEWAKTRFDVIFVLKIIFIPVVAGSLLNFLFVVMGDWLQLPLLGTIGTVSSVILVVAIMRFMTQREDKKRFKQYESKNKPNKMCQTIH